MNIDTSGAYQRRESCRDNVTKYKDVQLLLNIISLFKVEILA
jgi:hypothetical protein